MKKKITIETGKTRLVDYEEQKRKIENLRDKMNQCQLKRDYVGVARLKGQIIEAIKILDFIEHKQMVTLSDLAKDIDEKEKLKFSAKSVSIILLADLLNYVAMDLQETMNKMGAPAHLNVMHAVKAIKDNSSAFVRMFDNASDEEGSSRFAELSDSILNYIQLHTMEFAKREKRRNVLHL